MCQCTCLHNAGDFSSCKGMGGVVEDGFLCLVMVSAMGIWAVYKYSDTHNILACHSTLNDFHLI